MSKKVLVTGGTRGIGLAIAKRMQEAGFQVVVTGSSQTGKVDGCEYLACDFSDQKATEAFSKKIAEMEFSVLVNNAGINKIGVLTEYDVEDFTNLHQVNVVAPFLLCKAVVPGMQKRKFGRIVNITSIFGVVSKAERSAYSASKFALAGMTRALALETAKDNVLVNCLAPGFVDTELTRRVLGEEGIKEMLKRVPIGRLVSPKEIAQYALFLASDQNTCMTGQTIIVDGGFTCE